ncbi:MAG: hypothetical protein ACLRWF_09195 [Ruthenibacterium sp.]
MDARLRRPQRKARGATPCSWCRGAAASERVLGSQIRRIRELDQPVKTWPTLGMDTFPSSTRWCAAACRWTWPTRPN